MSDVALVSGARARRALPVLTALAASLMLGACASGGASPLMSEAQAPSARLASTDAPKSELQKATDYWGKKAAENPGDPRAAVNYAKNLKAMGSKREALMVLQQAHASAPHDRELNSEYGRLALEHNQVTVAQKLLEQADDQANPDWRVISARGTVAAKQGKHIEAITFFERARQIAPEQPSILNNLAMAHAMNGQATKAEGFLRQAALKPDADPRVQQNLALVLGLNGKHDEAKVLGADSLPTDASTHNAEVVRQLVQANEPADADVPVARVAAVAAPDARPSKAAKLATASVQSSAPVKGKAKGKATPVEPEVDASELVRRLADGDTGAPKR